jgi:choline-glycine betaine transporter
MKIKPLVFFPPFLCFFLCLLQALGGGEAFFAELNQVQDWVLTHLNHVFTWGTFSLVLACVITFFSPLGKIRIGGEKAKPLLNRWRWFAVTLCTTVAVGILFWGTAEPLFHFHQPALFFKGVTTDEKIRFSLSSLFMHWSITPYAIYTLPALVFALTYYNLKKPFSLSAPLSPLLGDRVQGRVGEIIDSICLFALVAGMSASLGTGILTLSGGIRYLSGISQSGLLLGLILLAVVVAFVLSAITGLTRGIRILSEINAVTFFVLVLFVLVVGPTRFIFSNGLAALGDYLVSFIPRSIYSGVTSEVDPWAKSWTLFYWCNWLSWAPITALFLGRIGYGYTVREFIFTNLILPALFACVWMSVFSGWALQTDLSSAGEVFQTIKTSGVEAALYALFGKLSVSPVIKTGAIGLVVITAFLAYVTSAEANTSAMAAMSTQGISPESPEAPILVKILWGVCIGLTAWIMVTRQGVDGIKTISVLGGVPCLFLILLILGSWGRILFSPKKMLND